jgi:hypothetical protein
VASNFFAVTGRVLGQMKGRQPIVIEMAIAMMIASPKRTRANHLANRPMNSSWVCGAE